MAPMVHRDDDRGTGAALALVATIVVGAFVGLFALLVAGWAWLESLALRG
jgi:hypothetical protein